MKSLGEGIHTYPLPNPRILYFGLKPINCLSRDSFGCKVIPSCNCPGEKEFFRPSMYALGYSFYVFFVSTGNIYILYLLCTLFRYIGLTYLYTFVLSDQAYSVTTMISRTFKRGTKYFRTNSTKYATAKTIRPSRAFTTARVANYLLFEKPNI